MYHTTKLDDNWKKTSMSDGKATLLLGAHLANLGHHVKLLYDAGMSAMLAQC